MPVSAITQPLLWSHADSLHLMPEPDFLVLADSTDHYEFKVPVDQDQNRFINVVNPGSFKVDTRFVVIYPESGAIEESQIEK